MIVLNNMVPFTLADAILYLRPGASFSCGAEKDSEIEWLDESDAPSREEIDAIWDEAVRVYKFNFLRGERNRLLAGSDWTQLPDAPVDANAWAEYRQALRDLPENTTDPENPVWPTPPE